MGDIFFHVFTGCVRSVFYVWHTFTCSALSTCIVLRAGVTPGVSITMPGIRVSFWITVFFYFANTPAYSSSWSALVSFFLHLGIAETRLLLDGEGEAPQASLFRSRDNRIVHQCLYARYEACDEACDDRNVWKHRNRVQVNIGIAYK